MLRLDSWCVHPDVHIVHLAVELARPTAGADLPAYDELPNSAGARRCVPLPRRLPRRTDWLPLEPENKHEQRLYEAVRAR